MSCCTTPRPDCMGMLLPSIGDRCQALQAELLRFPRPGPQIPARRCEHAASGCNYPEGDCAGLCLVAKPAKAA